jgi:hypothetical protein
VGAWVGRGKESGERGEVAGEREERGNRKEGEMEEGEKRGRRGGTKKRERKVRSTDICAFHIQTRVLHQHPIP